MQSEERARFRELVKRRAEERVPVAYLTGMREFWSLTLAVTPDVLVPRPDTETLIEAVLAELPDVEAELCAFDLGTGSGAIALALAKERPKLRVVASDVSAAALAVAEQNASRHGLADRVRFVQGAGFEPVMGQRFHAIVSNPPYLAEAEAGALAPELTSTEKNRPARPNSSPKSPSARSLSTSTFRCSGSIPPRCCARSRTRRRCSSSRAG